MMYLNLEESRNHFQIEPQRQTEISLMSRKEPDILKTPNEHRHRCTKYSYMNMCVINSRHHQLRISWTVLTMRSLNSVGVMKFRLIAFFILAIIQRMSAFSLTKPSPYVLPTWAKDILSNIPLNGRLSLANLPTPLYRLETKTETTVLQRIKELNISLYIKRDDMTGGCETGGNKIRKLEFLMADALASGHDAVVTIGGEQSNHCRATAAAARMVGLEPHLILRTGRANAVQEKDAEFGMTGNLLFDRMVGSTIYTCTPGEYGRVGSTEIVEGVCTHLTRKGKKPYGIPVGGSNWLGSWGYIQGVDEVLHQWKDSDQSLDHVVFACGSGGTAAGIALGFGLAPEQSPSVHAVAVCDDPDYFYNYVANIADDMGFQGDALAFIKGNMVVHQGKGLGYASSTPEELNFVTQFAVETGILLDPVYSGKALYHFVTNVLEQDPEAYRGNNVLFWHTGGALGLFDKGNDLFLNAVSPVKRLDFYKKNDDGMVSM